MMQGTVTSVQSVRRGGVALSWVGTDLVLVEGSDFPAEGGTVTVAGVTGTVGYSAATLNADGTTTLTMGRDAGADAFTAERRVDTEPPQWDVWAEVEIAGASGALQCLVPHNLRPLLADGAASLPVTVERVGESWQVVDVLGRKGQVQPDGLSPEAWDQIGATGVKIWHEFGDPAMSGTRAGDLWYRHDPVNWAVVGLWTWDGAEWMPTQLSGTVLDNVDAGSITTGALQGIAIASPAFGAFPRVEVGIDPPDPAVPLRVAVIGDSISEGTGASSLEKRWMNLAQQTLNTMQGLPAGATWPHIPARYITSTTAGRPVAWSGGNANNSYGLGWRTLELNSVTSTVTFTFTGTKAELLFLAASGTGKAAVVVDDKPTVVVDTNYPAMTAGNMRRWVVPGITAGGSHTITVSYDTSSEYPVYLEGMLTWNNDEPGGVRLLDASYHGWSYASTASVPLRMTSLQESLKAVNADVIVSALGMNDITANNPSKFRTDVQAHLDAYHAARPGVPVLLVCPYRSSSHTVSQFTAHQKILHELADADPLVTLLDLSASMPVASTGPSGEGLYADALHPNDAGNARIAELIAPAVLRIAGRAGLRAWDSSGNLTARVDGVDNLVTGTFRTVALGSGPGVTVVNSTSAGGPGVYLSATGNVGGGDAAVYIDQQAHLHVRSVGSNAVRFPSAPDVTFAANAYLDSNKGLYRTGSARRLKINIQDLADEIDPRAILDVPARIWSDRAEVEARRERAAGRDPQLAVRANTRVPGFVAEEVAAALPQFATYDASGKPDGVMYDRLIAALLEVVKGHERTITELTARIERLES